MVFEIIILALIIGKLRGGQFQKLENLYIKGWYILVLSFSIEIISLLIVTKTNSKMNKLVENNFSYIHIFIYSLLIIGLCMNYKERGLRITLIGSILNFLPLALNNGKMPVAINALKNANLYNQLNLLSDNRIMTHTLVSESTKLNFLGDIIAISKPYPFPKIISIGDILISVGLFILIYNYMTERQKHTKEYIHIFKP